MDESKSLAVWAAGSRFPQALRARSARWTPRAVIVRSTSAGTLAFGAEGDSQSSGLDVAEVPDVRGAGWADHGAQYCNRGGLTWALRHPCRARIAELRIDVERRARPPIANCSSAFPTTAPR